MSKKLCKGGCGKPAMYNGWCKIKWKSNNKFMVACPVIEMKRKNSISKFRIKEAKEGKNPMQNPVICAKNHSKKRNKRSSNTLKKIGKLGLLPQQKENKKLKEKRRKNISLSLKKLWKKGKHPRQLETYDERHKRSEKIAKTMRKLGKQGKLPIQNMTEKQKKEFSKKISKKLIEGIKTGRIKLSRSWKKVLYKNLILRSYWEKTVAEFLDKKNLNWEYESLKINYWDTQRDIDAITIPDFYIPSLNTVIEVKSNAEFKSIRTNDKTKGIKKQGFNAILVGKKEIDLIKNNEFTILEEIINEKSKN